MAATPATLAARLSVAQPAMGALITFSCVSNILASICNLGSCLGLPTSAGVADGPRKNNNAITVKMAGKGDPRRKEVPQPSPVARLERPNVRPPRQRAGFHAQIW